jgi:hypothetical protein
VQLRIENNVALPAGVRLTLVPRNAATQPLETARNTYFDFVDVPSGNYDLRVELPRQNFFISELSANGRDLRDFGIAVSDVERFFPVNLTLDLQPAFISGRVLDESGKPYPGAGVVAWSTDPQRRLQESSFKTTFADAGGNFRLANLVPGEYFVAIWTDYDPHLALEPEVLRRLEGSAVRINALRQENVAGELRVTNEVRAIPESYVR